MSLKTLVIIISAIPLVIAGYLFIQGMISKSGKPVGIVDGRLAPCPDKPNCVCSEFLKNERHYFEPLNIIAGKEDDAWQQLQAIIGDQGGKIITANERYLAAEFTSRVFGFVDDFEARLDAMNRQIQLRSASRVGTSDFGVNRKRINTISELLKDYRKDK